MTILPFARPVLIPTFVWSLGIAAALAVAPVQAQQAKEPPPKEVTDGFFDVPARESEPSWGLPAYLVTSALGGGAIFVLCKSARRS